MVAGLQQQLATQQMQGAAAAADVDRDFTVGVEPQLAAVDQRPLPGMPGSGALCLQAALFAQPVQAEQGDRTDAEGATEAAKRATAATSGSIECRGSSRCRQWSKGLPDRLDPAPRVGVASIGMQPCVPSLLVAVTPALLAQREPLCRLLQRRAGQCGIHAVASPDRRRQCSIACAMYFLTMRSDTPSCWPISA